MSGPAVPRETRRLLLIRLHSLGDVTLTTGLIQPLADGASALLPGRIAVDVLTEERFLPVFRGHPGVHRLWSIDRPPQEGKYDRVVDLQGTPGSRVLARRFGPVSTVRTRAAARRWVVLWGDRFPRPRIPHATERYAQAAGLSTPLIDMVRHVLAPTLHVTREEEAEARRLAPEAFREAPGRAVALLIGASRRSKAYPAEEFRSVQRRLLADGVATWWIAPPGSDVSWVEGPPVFRLPLGPLKAVLARSAAAVTGDTGPMHMATGLGVPVIALFGSSVPAFGFSPSGPRDRVLAVEDLACRPCGVHGRDHCWLGHWRCLRGITPEDVVSEVRRALDAAKGREGEAAPAASRPAGGASG